MKKSFVSNLTKSTCLIVACITQWQESRAQEHNHPQVVKNLVPAIRIADNVQLKIGGHVRTEYLFDSREPVAALNDLVGFFPANKRPDANGKDLADVSRSSLSAKGTCLNMSFTGPDVLNARSNAFFEVDFTGSANQAVNLCFCRAYIQLNWEKAELLLGKTWNPLGDTPDPGLGGLAGTPPYRPFGRSEQIRLVLKPVQNFRLWLAGVYQTEHAFATDGAPQNGGADIKNTILPELHLQLRYESPRFSAGLVSAYKNIRPRISIGERLVENTLSSYALGGFADFNSNGFVARAGVTFGQNMGEYLMIGGYAVKEADATGIPSYTPLKVAAGWAFLGYAGKRWSPGVFFGYTRNNGFEDELKQSGEQRTVASGALGDTSFGVAYAYRIAPMLKYTVERLTFSAELEYNAAAYGTEFDERLKATKSETVGALRFRFITAFTF